MKNKMFNKQTLAAAAISYLLVGLSFVYGLIAWSPGGWLNFGRMASGILLVIMVTPFVILLGIIIVAVWRKSLFAVIGFLIISFGTWGVLGGTFLVGGIVSQYRAQVSFRQRAAFLEERMNLIEETIAPVIRQFYPDVEFDTGEFGQFTDVTRVRLSGFTWENQPDFDREIETWRHIMQYSTLRQYPNRIRVAYFFEDTPRHSFASFGTQEFDVRFSSRGMSEEGFEIVKSQFIEYLNGYDDEFDVMIFSNALRVTIYRRIEPDEEEYETIRWQRFLEEHNINTGIANINVHYRIPGTTLGSTRFIQLDLLRWH